MNLRQIILACALLALCGFSSQPIDERKLQDTLPTSKDAMWETLAKTKIKVDEKKGLFSAKVPPEVKAYSGKEVTIKGFMLPLEATTKFKNFLLSKRTPTCPYCPPGEPNEVIDVWTSEPVAYTEDMVTVKGKFSLMDDREKGLFFKIKEASVH